MSGGTPGDVAAPSPLSISHGSPGTSALADRRMGEVPATCGVTNADVPSARRRSASTTGRRSADQTTVTLRRSRDRDLRIADSVGQVRRQSTTTRHVIALVQRLAPRQAPAHEIHAAVPLTWSPASAGSAVGERRRCQSIQWLLRSVSPFTVWDYGEKIGPGLGRMAHEHSDGWRGSWRRLSRNRCKPKNAHHLRHEVDVRPGSDAAGDMWLHGPISSSFSQRKCSNVRKVLLR